MCGPVSGSEYSNKWVVNRCCCGCSLRVGCLILGWNQVIGCIISIVQSALGATYRSYEYSLYVSYVFNLVAGLVLIIGVYKLNAKLVWITVYIYLCPILLSIILAIVFFVYLNWPLGIALIIVTLILFYYFLVVRSYAFEVEAGRGSPVTLTPVIPA